MISEFETNIYGEKMSEKSPFYTYIERIFCNDIDLFQQ